MIQNVCSPQSQVAFAHEFPLVVSSADQRALNARFEVARHAYNAALNESLRRLSLMRESRAYRATSRLPRGRAKTQEFRKLRSRFGLTEFSIDSWASRNIGRQWLGQHLDALSVRALARRAFRAVSLYGFGQQGRPRFKGPNQLDSVQGLASTQGIRFKHRNRTVEWLGLKLRARFDERDAHLAHALKSDVKFVRIVRRRVKGQVRYYAQLVFSGQPYTADNPIGNDVVGIDPGITSFAIASSRLAAKVRITSMRTSASARRRLSRRIERRRRLLNPQLFARDGRLLPGGHVWRKSNALRNDQVKLAEIHRRNAAQRKTLVGELANAVLTLGRDIRIERNSYRAFQRRYRKVSQATFGAALVSSIVRKAANAGGRASLIPPSLRLSQTCHGCGGILKKDLDLRIHVCDCGVGPVQRDLYSAWLATVTSTDPTGSVWWIDADQAKRAWSGAELRLPVASTPISIASFKELIETQAASGGDLHVASLLGRTEQLAGEVHAKRDEARDDVSVSLRARESREGRHHMGEIASARGTS